jgi:hypothetical protein
VLWLTAAREGLDDDHAAANATPSATSISAAAPFQPVRSRTGNRVADEQADRFGSASRVLICLLWIARPGDLRELVLRDRHRGAVTGSARRHRTCRCALDGLASTAVSAIGRVGSGPAPPAALRGGDPSVNLRQTVLVGFAPNDLSGQIARPAGPQGRNSAGRGRRCRK